MKREIIHSKNILRSDLAKQEKFLLENGASRDEVRTQKRRRAGGILTCKQ